MPHARGEKSSAWNGQAATNQTPNPSQYVLVSFHLISRAIRPLQPTPSGSLFSKIQDKTTPKGRVHFHHDTRPLKTRLVTLPPLQTKPHPGTTPSLVIDNFWFEIAQIAMDRKNNHTTTKTSKVNTVSCILLNILANIYRRCGTRVMRWNETRTYWLGFGVWFVAAWPFQAEDFSPLAWGVPNWTVKPCPFSYSGNSGLKEMA